MTRRVTTGTMALVAAGFLLVQLAWILTMPPAAGIDEFDHIHRAASVASGHWGFSHEEIDREAGRGGLIPVPSDVVAVTRPGCESFVYTRPANCNAYRKAGGALVMVASGAARYNPTFYVLVGYPSSLFDGTAALTVMRVVAAMLSTAMLVLATLATRTWARTGWPLLALFVSATPTVMYSTSIAAPNGLNVASGLTLWSALLGLLYGDGTPTTRRRLLTIAAVAAVTLVNTHTLGLAWLFLIVVAVAIQRGSLRVPQIALAERRHTRTTLATTSMGIVFAVGWVLVAHTNSPTAEATSFTGSWWHQALTVGMPVWPLQAIAAFPMREETAPLAVYAIGASLMCCFAAIAVLTLARRRAYRSLLTIAFVAVVSYAMPLVLTAISFRHIGLAWQGRYGMPFTGGLLLLYGLALDRTTARLMNPVAIAVMALVAIMNLMSQLHVIDNFAGTTLVRATGWHSPAPLLLAALALGYAACGALALRATPRERQA